MIVLRFQTSAKKIKKNEIIGSAVVNALELGGFTRFCATFIGDDMGLCVFLSHRSSAPDIQMSELTHLYDVIEKVALSTATSLRVSILDIYVKF